MYSVGADPHEIGFWHGLFRYWLWVVQSTGQLDHEIHSPQIAEKICKYNSYPISSSCYSDGNGSFTIIPYFIYIGSIKFHLDTNNNILQ